MLADLDPRGLPRRRVPEESTDAHLSALEKMLLESGAGNADDVNRARDESHGLGLFIRSLVGLDRHEQGTGPTARQRQHRNRALAEARRSTTTFEVRGLRQEVRYFTSFSAYSLTGGLADALRTRTVPRITRFDDRWRWLETSVVPRFRRLDADQDLVDRTLGRVVEEAKRYADRPCLVPT